MRGECILTKFTEDTGLDEVLICWRNRKALQSNPDALDPWTGGICMRFKVVKYQLLHLGCSNPTHYRLGGKCLESC